jgi:O-antigen/teichoic acid export membrane protein
MPKSRPDQGAGTSAVGERDRVNEAENGGTRSAIETVADHPHVSSADATRTPPARTHAPWATRARWLRRSLLRSTLARSSSAYVASNILNRSVPFLLIPVITRYLSPADIGIAAMYMLALGLVAPLVGMSTDTAIARKYFDRDQIDFPNYVTNCLYILLVSTIVVGAVVIPLAEPIGSLLAIPAGWVWTLVLVATARYLVSVVLALWQMRQMPKHYAAYSLAQMVIALGLSVALIVGFGWGWEGRVVGDVASFMVMGFVGALVLVRGGWIRRGVDQDHVSHALRYGGGLIPHLYGGFLIAATDRFFITHMIGIDETGLYVVGLQIAMIIGVLEHSFNQAWVPWIFGVLKRSDPAELAQVVRITRIYNVVIVLLALGLAAAAPWFLGFFVGPSFRDASQFVLWLALGGAFSGMYKMVVSQIYFANKTHWLAWITFATGVANVIFNYLLIRANGAVGAAQGTALALLVSYLLTAWLSARVMPMAARGA